MAALEVQEALKLIHGMPVAAGSALVFNGVTNQFYTTKLPFRDDCLSHETYPEPIELPIGHAATGRRAVRRRAARRSAGPLTPGPRSRPGRRRSSAPVAAGGTRSSGPARRSRWPRPSARPASEPAGPRSSAPIEEGSPLADRPLADAGHSGLRYRAGRRAAADRLLPPGRRPGEPGDGDAEERRPMATRRRIDGTARAGDPRPIPSRTIPSAARAATG